MDPIKDIVEALDKGIKAGAYDFHSANKYIAAIQLIEQEIIRLRNELKNGEDAKLKKS